MCSHLISGWERWLWISADRRNPIYLCSYGYWQCVKQVNKNLKIVSDICISSILDHADRLISGVVNKNGPQCKIECSPSTCHQISPTNWQSWFNWVKNDLLERWSQKDVDQLFLLPWWEWISYCQWTGEDDFLHSFCSLSWILPYGSRAKESSD